MATKGKSKPNNPSLWSSVKSQAKKKFDVYPCVPLHAQAISRSGFVDYKQVEEGQEILAYDISTGALVWSKVLGINYFENAPTIQVRKATGFSVECTRAHKWVVEQDRVVGGRTGTHGHKGKPTIKRSLIEAEDFNKRMDIVWCGSPLEGTPLENNFWAKHDDWIPRILSMTPAEREAFLAASIIYDGCDQGASAKRKGGRTFGFTQKNENHYWATVLAAFCNGYYVSTYQKTETIKGATIIRGKRTHNTQNLLVTESVQQDVWCPTTEHQTWVMAQNNTLCVTGNSAYANAWAAKEYKKKGGTWSGADNRVKKRG